MSNHVDLNNVESIESYIEEVQLVAAEETERWKQIAEEIENG